MKLDEKYQEVYDEVNKVFGEAYDELKNFENLALERFRELADIKNRVDKLCSRIIDIELKITSIGLIKEKNEMQ